MASSYYEIRVAGILPPEALLDFERLTASVEPVETVVHGPLPDQSALTGLLARLETFGVEVIEVRRLHAGAPPADDDRKDDRPSEGPARNVWRAGGGLVIQADRTSRRLPVIPPG